MTAVVLPESPDETGSDYVDVAEGLAGATCLDLNGDGVVDNGLGSLTGTLLGFGVDANAELTKAVSEGALRFVFFLDPRSDFDRFVAFVASPEGDPVTWLASTASEGQPLLELSHSTLSDGHLESSPEEASLDGILTHAAEGTGFPVPTMAIGRPRLVATLEGTYDLDGARFVSGAFGGAIYKAEIDLALYDSRMWCQTDPTAPVDECGYIEMADMSLIETFMVWDLDVAGCDRELNVYDANDPMLIVGHEPNCQALSFCLFWTGEKARILAAESQ